MDSDPPPLKPPAPDPREARLAAQLRANLRRRKAPGREQGAGSRERAGVDPAVGSDPASSE